VRVRNPVFLPYHYAHHLSGTVMTELVVQNVVLRILGQDVVDRLVSTLSANNHS